MVDGGSALVVGGSFLSLRASSREGNSVRMERVGGERVEMDANGVVHLHFCHFTPIGFLALDSVHKKIIDSIS